MANILDDNTVIPSYLSSFPTGTTQDTGIQTNVALRVGEIRALIYPTDPRNVNRRYIEYTVEVQEKTANGPGVSTMYAGVVALNLFGSGGDIFRYTYRKDDAQQHTEDGIGVGAKVAILCVNGDTTKAVIIGGFRDTFVAPDVVDEDQGHNLFFEFNGLQTSINTDGELQVKFKGATKVDGTLEDRASPEASGSTVIFDRDGGIKLFTPEQAQYVYLDHANHKIDILADTECHVQVNGRLFLEAEQNIDINGRTQCSIEVPNNIFLRSAGVKVGAATEAWMLGTSYRTAEAIKHTTMASVFASLSGVFATAGGVLATTAILHAIPVVGPIIGAPLLATAAAALISTGPMFASLGSAIGSFEGGSASYLSVRNSGD